MKTILVVDDMAIFREPIEVVLRAEGINVIAACNGMQALALLETHRPDLILLDLGMPVLPGMAVLRHIRSNAPLQHIPVIILSAETDRSRIVDAAKLGISGYLLKSHFSLSAMLAAVTKAFAAPDVGDATPLGRGESTLSTPVPTATAASEPAIDRLRQDSTTPAAKPEATDRTLGKTPAPPAQKATGRSILPIPLKLTPDSDLKSMRPLMTRSELLERIGANGELTGFSPTVAQILKVTARPNCSMDQVAKAVSQDHAVALKILKLANSSVYSRGDRVDTVHKAVLRIGMQNIRQAVLNIGVVERFGALAFDCHLSTPLFWEHSIACGIIAAELAHALKHKEPDIAFTAGLLHDLGRVICAERLGEQYIHVLEVANAIQLPLEQVESRLMLLSHADVMDRILHTWQFPKDLVNPIVFHHTAPLDVRSVAPRQTAEVLRLGLADRLAHAMVLGSSGNDTIYPTEEHCRLLGVEPATVNRIEEIARQQTDDTKIALLSNSNGAAWPRRIEQHRAELKAPFRPLYVSVSPDIDAYRIFCGELASPLVGEPPNLAVLHIAAAKERVVTRDLLLGMEQKAGIQGLPALILSPGGRFSLPEGVLADRRSVSLSTPTSVSRLIATINNLLGGAALQTAA